MYFLLTLICHKLQEGNDYCMKVCIRHTNALAMTGAHPTVEDKTSLKQTFKNPPGKTHWLGLDVSLKKKKQNA
jgi:hypothetical protein